MHLAQSNTAAYRMHRASSEARRQKVLARGAERLNKITGTADGGDGLDKGPAEHGERTNFHALRMPANAPDDVTSSGAIAVEKGVEKQEYASTSQAAQQQANQRQHIWGNYAGPDTAGLAFTNSKRRASSTTQALMLAVKTTHAARTLMTLAFAQLCYSLSGKPRPLSVLLGPFWALVTGTPPLLLLVTLLLAFTTAIYTLLKHKPAVLEAHSARSLLEESQLKLGFMEKLVPGLRRAIETSLQWVTLLKSLGDCVALYLVVIAVSSMYGREVLGQ